MSANRVTGSCLCGSVRYELRGNVGVFQYCHCSRCRKFSGSAFASNLFVAPGDFSWTAGENRVGRYEPEATRHFATSFCTRCGSSLPWLAKSGKVVVVPAGTLDEDSPLRPQQNVYWGSRAPWYTEPGTLPQHEELPPRKS